VSAAPRWIRGPAWSCSGCGRRGATAMARADLDTLWLLPSPGGLLERRFCRACVPPGPVGEVACMRCGDGPLLSGELAGADTSGAAAVQGWLTVAGWRLVGPVCPDCVGELTR
jgi:hypothetical protein